MDDLCNAIPTAVRRRLWLNLVGWRLRDGVWHAPHGTQTLDEEMVDEMSDLHFATFLARDWWGECNGEMPPLVPLCAWARGGRLARLALDVDRGLLRNDQRIAA
jgi:hypothetical protein